MKFKTILLGLLLGGIGAANAASLVASGSWTPGVDTVASVYTDSVSGVTVTYASAPALGFSSATFGPNIPASPDTHFIIQPGEKVTVSFPSGVTPNTVYLQDFDEGLSGGAGGVPEVAVVTGATGSVTVTGGANIIDATATDYLNPSASPIPNSTTILASTIGASSTSIMIESTGTGAGWFVF